MFPWKSPNSCLMFSLIWFNVLIASRCPWAVNPEPSAAYMDTGSDPSLIIRCTVDRVDPISAATRQTESRWFFFKTLLASLMSSRVLMVLWRLSRLVFSGFTIQHPVSDHSNCGPITNSENSVVGREGSAGFYGAAVVFVESAYTEYSFLLSELSHCNSILHCSCTCFKRIQDNRTPRSYCPITK